MVSNDKSALKCAACESPNPNAPKSSAPAPSSTAPSFKFGVEKSTSEAPPNVTAETKSSGFGDFMAKQKASSAKSERWSCDVCMISNEKTADKCAACETPNPKAPAKTESAAKPSFVFGVSEPAKETPKATTSSAPSAASSGGFGDLLAKQKAAAASKWTCDICMVSNDTSALKCLACESPNPNAPKGSSDESKTESNSAPKFTFGIPSNEAKTTSATPSFTGFGAKPAEKKEPPAAPVVSTPVVAPPAGGGFGDLLAKQKAAAASKWTCDVCMVSNDASALKCLACESPNPKAPAQAAPAAESSSAPPKFVFGVQSSAPTEAKKDAPSFSFGAPASQPATTEPTKPSFSFGAPTPAKEPSPAPKLKRGRDTSSTPSSNATSSGFSFGSSSAPAKKEAPSFSFGAPSATPTPAPPASEPAKPSFSFGAPAATPASTPAPASGFSFGAKQEETKPAAPSFSFGAPKETPAPAATGGSLFGASEPKATPSFSFGGAPKQEEKPAAAPSFSFGGGASKPAGGFGNQSSGSIFAPKVEEKQPSFNFTASKPAEQAPSFSFGAPQNAAPSGGSLFGAAPQQNQTPAPSFNFGASNNAPQQSAPSMFTPSKPVSFIFEFLYSLYGLELTIF